MDILKNIFKHKVNIQDVFSSLENFSSDIKTLSAVRDTATAFFGNNWRFDMEMYIASLPQNYRAKYYDIFKQVLEYEHAVELWTRATQIVNASRSISSDDLKDIPEYHRYLLKFGIEGERLYSRLLSVLGVDKETANSLPDVSQSSINQQQSPISSDTDIAKEEFPSSDKINDIEDENFTNENDNASDETETTLDNTIDEDSEYRRQLRNKIMQRVHEISTSQSSSNSQSNQQNSDDSLQEDSNIEPHLDVAESKIPVDQNSQSEQMDLSANIDNEDWDIASFVHLNKFLDLSTSIMPAVVLYKNAASLEEYKYYGFIIDVLDYAIAKGSKILSINSDSEIRKYYQGGRAELENIIVSYRHLRDDQVVLSPSDIQTDTNDDVEEQPYIRPDNS